ncbi:hypothetical protein HNP52_004443 [Sphingomonas kyeonggiensis]|uniref:Uncharacterized protein n=1 Tax=Sphingomonas kyeonggiensis TaxID=1268553 RepID=A0A7W7K6A9_9SPHN|nr:hypothetical protein [Sphingomonas kyeonggiensis]MBB4841341.1 hypothetical protein [Sphingomonas kyeonggiensis]
MAPRETHRHWTDRGPVENPALGRGGAVRLRYSRALIEETIRVWQPYYEAPLTEADAHQIIENMTMFAGALMGLGGIVRPRGEDLSETDKSRP